jgi:hypothetical protein
VPLLWIMLSYFVGVVVHELGHAACGRMVGIPIALVSIGDGPRLFQFKVRNTAFAVNAYPMCGFCKPSENWTNRGWRSVFFGLGGVIGNLALIVALLAADASDLLPDGSWSVIGLMIFVQCWLIAFSIVPMRGQDAKHLSHANDGYLIWAMLRGQMTVSATFMEQAMARYRKAGAAPDPLTDAAVRRDCHAQIIAELDRGRLSATEEMAVLDGLINEWFQSGDAELTGRVEHWSERLIALGPGIDTVKGTRGGVLVSLGRHSEGQALLLPLHARLKTTDFDRIMTEVLLARATLGLGQRSHARLWINAAKVTSAAAGYTDGQLAIVAKVEAEIAAAEAARV